VNPEAATHWTRRLGAGLLVSSLCLLALELTLSRIFSVLMWYHFVSLIVSLALFGITVSGLAVFLAPRRFPRETAAAWMGRASLALALALLGLWSFFLLLARSPQLAYRILAPFHQPQYEPFGAGKVTLLDSSQVLPLVVLYLVSALPFIFGGFIATLALTRYQDSVARVYAWDLAGAGLGCVAAFALLTWLDPFATLAVLAFFAALAAWLFFRESGGRVGALGALALGALALCLGAATARGGIVELKFVRGRYQPDLLLTRWNSYSRVAVWPLRTGQGEASWGMSRSYRGPIPEQYGLVVDDTGYTTIARYRPGDELGWARANLLSLPYRVREEARALIVGPGGGKDILIALANGAAAVRAVELNPLVVRAVQDDFGDFSGRPYTLPRVEKVVDEGRTFLAHDPSFYDVIQATVVYGRLAPAAGAFTFTEDHLYTTEAFQTYLDRLAPGGMLAFSRFIYEKRILRLVATARAALEARNISDAPGCIFIAAERGLASVLIKNAPFTPEELERLQLRCRELGFQVLYAPGGEGDSPIAELLRAPDAAAHLAALPFDASPVGDDRPFYYYLMRPRDFLRSGAALAPDFEDRGLLLMRNLLFTVLGLVALCIALPLALYGRAREIRWGRAWASVGYFAAIGLGFMVVEIGLLKRFLLLLGKPSYTLAVTLSIFLVAGALGSARARRLAGSARLVRRSCARLTIVLLFTAVLLPPLLEMLLAAPLWARLAATVAVMGPLGYLMGQPLPAGLSLVRQERLVPWVWSVNGALSVLGSIGALVLAVNFGYTTTMLVGPACYLAAGALAELVE
jgi:spermidine synthase